MIGTNLTNWATDASNKEHRKQAIKLAKERKEWEKGKTVTKEPIPGNPRCYKLIYK